MSDDREPYPEVWEKAYHWLIGLYGYKRPDEAEKRVYWSVVRKVEWSALRKAIAGAATTWPSKFPTAGELLAEGVRRQRMERRKSTPDPEPEPYEEPKLYEGNPFLDLARKWEKEMREYMMSTGLGPASPIPIEDAVKRINELMALFGESDHEI